MSEGKVCHVCGEPCEGGWGWVLFEFWDIPHPAFYKMEQAAIEIEKRPLCRKHLVHLLQVVRDYLQSSGDLDAFIQRMEARRES